MMTFKEVMKQVMRLSILQDMVQMKTRKSQLETAQRFGQANWFSNNSNNGGYLLDYQHHLLNDEEDYTMGDRGNFFEAW